MNALRYLKTPPKKILILRDLYTVQHGYNLAKVRLYPIFGWH